MTDLAQDRPIVVLAGGVGAARFVAGLQQALDPAAITMIANTGDDLELWGLAISPDLDTLLYTLSGQGDADRGWGLAGETFRATEALRRIAAHLGKAAGAGRLPEPDWFALGDVDLATHLFRTHHLRSGASLSQVTAWLAHAAGLRLRLLPMSNDPVRTFVMTPEGELPFQEWFVQRHFEPPVTGVRFQGAGSARPAPGVLEAIAAAQAIVIAPSNPFVSIAPILAIPAIDAALRSSRVPRIAVTPIIGGAAVKGPAGRMLTSLGYERSALGVARRYEGLATHFVLDERDAELATAIAALGMAVVATDTLMVDVQRQRALAEAVLALL